MTRDDTFDAIGYLIRHLENIRSLQEDIKTQALSDVPKEKSTTGLPPCGCKGECFNGKHPELEPQRSCRWDR